MVGMISENENKNSMDCVQLDRGVYYITSILVLHSPIALKLVVYIVRNEMLVTATPAVKDQNSISWPKVSPSYHSVQTVVQHAYRSGRAMPGRDWSIMGRAGGRIMGGPGIICM